MKFRPCIDIHNGKVKQIVGGSLQDQGDQAVTNYTSALNAAWYAKLYQRDGLKGGHIILLNAQDSPFFNVTREQALEALSAYPGGMQIGGGITADNGVQYLEAGASHVIVTSYVFQDGKFSGKNLEKLSSAVGKEHVVLDLSCRKKGNDYYIVTNRWQTYTNVCLNETVLEDLSQYCDEFLVHGVDVEGKSSGVELELVEMLAEWGKIPITYAGGIGSLEDLETFRLASKGVLDFTIGSALDLFGGSIPYEFIAK
jgi:phosphoribosylformimino-5-aminoimidazole carboxamide ribotide isomerase